MESMLKETQGSIRVIHEMFKLGEIDDVVHSPSQEFWADLTKVMMGNSKVIHQKGRGNEEC